MGSCLHQFYFFIRRRKSSRKCLILWSQLKKNQKLASFGKLRLKIYDFFWKRVVLGKIYAFWTFLSLKRRRALIGQNYLTRINGSRLFPFYPSVRHWVSYSNPAAKSQIIPSELFPLLVYRVQATIFWYALYTGYTPFKSFPIKSTSSKVSVTGWNFVS